MKSTKKKGNEKIPACTDPHEIAATQENMKMEIERDAKGRWISSGNPQGARDHRVVELRDHMRGKFPEIVDELTDAIKNGDGKLKAAALKIWFEFSVPKIRGHDILDMSTAAKAALSKVGDKPIEDQAKELLKMFYRGDVSEQVLGAASGMLQMAQHMKDERIEQMLAKYEAEQIDEK